MFCPKCGKQIPNESKFCPFCGNSFTAPPSRQPVPAAPAAPAQPAGRAPEPQQPPQSRAVWEEQTAPYGAQPQPGTAPAGGTGSVRFHCPRCKGHRLTMIDGTTATQSTSSGSGYGAGKGCLGYLILGPFGLLCGLCGKKNSSSSSQTTTQHFWCCQDCGSTFRLLDELKAEADTAGKRAAGSTILAIIFTALAIWSGYMVNFVTEDTVLIIFFVVSLLLAVPQLITAIARLVNSGSLHSTYRELLSQTQE